jgi:DNA-directed RNA polymerase specialized sigma subunit
MEKAIAEDSVLSMAKDMELSFWADEKEREYYFQQQRLLLDAYSDEHTWEVLLKQEKEKAVKEKEKAVKERDREVARSLLAIGGMDVEKIAQVSGLSEGEIRKLQNWPAADKS